MVDGGEGMFDVMLVGGGMWCMLWVVGVLLVVCDVVVGVIDVCIVIVEMVEIVGIIDLVGMSVLVDVCSMCGMGEVICVLFDDGVCCFFVVFGGSSINDVGVGLFVGFGL